MNTLQRIWAWFTSPWLPEPHAMCRVGLLNTGELVIIEPNGNLHCFSRDTTDVIERVVMERTDATVPEGPFFLSGRTDSGQPLPPIDGLQA